METILLTGVFWNMFLLIREVWTVKNKTVANDNEQQASNSEDFFSFEFDL